MKSNLVDNNSQRIMIFIRYSFIDVGPGRQEDVDIKKKHTKKCYNMAFGLVETALTHLCRRF